ncbi:hypothetical protein LCGC14_0632630 [marine sediment metagenome]|uniref:Uncharacterized protein n=1 Tax=marine sediment metagenome TaxID=412755 RepID=A0A0F9U9Z4_9ZZZZ
MNKCKNCVHDEEQHYDATGCYGMVRIDVEESRKCDCKQSIPNNTPRDTPKYTAVEDKDPDDKSRMISDSDSGSFILSDKMIRMGYDKDMYYEKDVAEFIRRRNVLDEKLYLQDISWEDYKWERQKLAGSKLLNLNQKGTGK